MPPGDSAVPAPAIHHRGKRIDARSIARWPSVASREITSLRTDPWPHAVGTPLYMAPEVWRGETASRRSDLYSLGILLYELLVGTTPYLGVTVPELPSVVQHRAPPRVADVAPGVEPALAAIVDRLVERDASARFASADALLVALEECATPPAETGLPDGNPYRGLAAFESIHGPLFFGRRREVRELVDRVRTEAFVVVGGDSGTGKSSLCRAGVLPWLAARDGWSCVDVIPARHPVDSLAAALAAWAGAGEAELATALRDSPDTVARAIRQNLVGRKRSPAGPEEPAPGTPHGSPRRLLLFVDQLEELLTLADPDEARVVAAALSALAVRTPSVRVLATARSDFLSRLAMLPGLGDELARGLYFLRPLTGEHIREVIVRPATTKGVVYESEALIDTLVEQTEHAPGGLPLLQFTLTELWDARDAGARMIRAEALAALGGVEGALTRHADQLLTGLGARERDAARRLVTAEGTRARRSEAELLSEGAGRDAERAALEVQGSPLMNLRVQQGELVAAQNYVTLRGPSLAGAHLYAEVQDLTASPPVAAPVEYRITSIVQEDAKYDPTYIGSTFLCTLEQNVDNSGSWQPACPVDADGRRAAIPLAATWNAHGDRVESSSLFTFGCTTGVIAKCYRWGYRPWVTGYGDLVAMHLTCTRLARADYCGNGTPHTRDGTLIDIWDNLPSPGPIQQHDAGLLAELLDFEAGWNTGGAVCLSHARWLDGGTLLAQACPDRLIPPILLLGVLLGGAVCDFESQVLGDGSNPLMFDETGLHLDLL